MENETAGRYERQDGLIPRKALEAANVAVIGVGAIGRQAAIMAGCMGFGKITLFDPDRVDDVNLAPQGFCPDELGQTKTYAVGHSLRRQNPDLEVVEHPHRFSRALADGCWGEGQNIALVCVDSIRDRKFIHGLLEESKMTFLIDARMAAEALRVISVPRGSEYYATTLFEPSEAFRGSCTAKSTVYCASIAAGIMLSQCRKIVCGFDPTLDLEYNLFAEDFTLKG